MLNKLAADVALVAGASDAAPATVPREQERLAVDKPATKARKPRTKKSASS